MSSKLWLLGASSSLSSVIIVSFTSMGFMSTHTVAMANQSDEIKSHYVDLIKWWPNLLWWKVRGQLMKWWPNLFIKFQGDLMAIAHVITQNNRASQFSFDWWVLTYSSAQVWPGLLIHQSSLCFITALEQQIKGAITLENEHTLLTLNYRR